MPEAAWTQLVTEDSAATFFQTPEWCLTWYRVFHDRYEPMVLTHSREGRLAALAPLAVERATRRLVFAGDTMTDYRDVVAVTSADRAAILAQVLHGYSRGRFRGELTLGPTHPRSTTPRFAPAIARVSGVATVTHGDISHHVAVGDEAAVRALLRKPTVRRRLNHYRRAGPVSLERITTDAQWNDVRDLFFAHHSARQRETGRSTVFDDEWRRAFQDELFARARHRLHVVALRVGDRVVAEHYGYVFRGVVYWAVPAHDVSERKHSPGQLLLALLIQDMAADGLTDLDFTPGDEEFKRRFATHTVDLQVIDAYRSRARHLRRRARDRAVRVVKRLPGYRPPS